MAAQFGVFTSLSDLARKLRRYINRLVQISFLERSIWTAPEAFTQDHRQ